MKYANTSMQTVQTLPAEHDKRRAEMLMRKKWARDEDAEMQEKHKRKNCQFQQKVSAVVSRKLV